MTIEPGTYPAELSFGLRSEIDVFLAEGGPEVTTELQRWPFVLGGPESWAEVRARG